MSIFFRGYEDLKAIRISELIQEHYTEDRTAGMQFEKKIRHRTIPFVIVTIASLVVVFIFALTELLTTIKFNPMIFPIIVGIGLICGIAVFSVLGISYQLPVLSRHTGKHMIKYRNPIPGTSVSVATIYVCPESRTYFAVSWEWRPNSPCSGGP